MGDHTQSSDRRMSVRALLRPDKEMTGYGITHPFVGEIN